MLPSMQSGTPRSSGQALASIWLGRLSRWDLVALPIVLGCALLLLHGAREMAVPLAHIVETPISLAPSALPGYALQTTLRMLVAMVASLLFTFTYGALAAKSRRLGPFLIAVLDILQSVPILGFLSFALLLLVDIVPGSAIGAELAAIFAIFTSQAWNMAFSFYQSLRTVPEELEEVARAFRMPAWLRFWRLEVPFAMPGLIWNMMMSMSGGWFFVVASEAITAGGAEVLLPGIGSYVATAIAAKNLPAIGWAIAAMLIVIGLYDQLLFRPLVTWSAKFAFEEVEAEVKPRSWLLRAWRRSALARALVAPLGRIGRRSLLVGAPLQQGEAASPRRREPLLDAIWGVVLAAGLAVGGYALVTYLGAGLGWSDLARTLWLGFLTLIRVVVLIALSSLVWVPVGVAIGLRPRLAQRVQPLIQFLAAFPANLLFPLVVAGVVHLHLSPDIWLSPLMILGAQWYILFNVIAGAQAIPADLRQVSDNLQVGGWLWWKRIALPAVFPYFVTGAITASGGAWNASIVAEIVTWGDVTLVSEGLGAYITHATVSGDHPRLILGIATMSAYVVSFNFLFWRPLYLRAERRFRIG